MKLVLTGDLHLGRTSTRLPPERRDDGRTLDAWNRLVDATVRAEAGALVLSGDLVDASNKLWESTGPLRDGLLRLHDAGIRTFAVAGNHDADVLPALADSLPDGVLHLLGRGGAWESVLIGENGRPSLRITGWSFPDAVVRHDPTRDFPAPPPDGIPTLGVVHGDPGAADSRYAPLSIARLQSLPVDGWLLGHIHKPSLTPGTPRVLMPGSPHPLDPGEPGAHHAWVLDTGEGGLPQPEPFCPAALRYRTVELPLTPEDEPDYAWIQRHLIKAAESSGFSGTQVLRVVFTGTSHRLEELETAAADLTDWRHANASVESVTLRVHPALDLQSAAQAGPVPHRLVDALHDLPPELRDRLDAVHRDLNHQKEFASLPPLSSDDLALAPLLERTLRHALRFSE